MTSSSRPSGLNTDYDEALVRGEPASGRFSVVYLATAGLSALDCVNMVKDFVQGRALVERRARLTPAWSPTQRPAQDRSSSGVNMPTVNVTTREGEQRVSKRPAAAR